MLGLIEKYDPDFYIDLHVTDGMDYQYDITYGFDGWDGLYADSPAIGKWLNDVYRPKADAALKAQRPHSRPADLRARRGGPVEGDRSQRVRAALQPCAMATCGGCRPCWWRTIR